jgi:DNA polymerase
MSADRDALLADLARYLAQQQEQGHVFFLETGELADPAAAAEPLRAETPAAVPRLAAAEEAATDPGPTAPAPPAREPAPGPPPAPPQAAPAADDPFAAECARFVRASLARIARARPAASGPPPAPAQEAMFASAPAAGGPPAGMAGPVPEDPAERAALLAELGETIRTCTRCGLHAGRQQAVPGAGNPLASLVLVGEAPGAEEDRQGLPFVGASGQLLTKILAAIGFSRQDVFICNILKCRPPGNRDPQADEVAACQGYLRRQLQIIRPRLILCLGRIAAQTLLGTSESLGRLRQEVRFYAGVPVMATYHPAALLRNAANKRATWDDVRKARALHDALGVEP